MCSIKNSLFPCILLMVAALIHDASPFPLLDDEAVEERNKRHHEYEIYSSSYEDEDSYEMDYSSSSSEEESDFEVSGRSMLGTILGAPLNLAFGIAKFGSSIATGMVGGVAGQAVGAVGDVAGNLVANTQDLGYSVGNDVRDMGDGIRQELSNVPQQYNRGYGYGKK